MKLSFCATKWTSKLKATKDNMTMHITSKLLTQTKELKDGSHMLGSKWIGILDRM